MKLIFMPCPYAHWSNARHCGGSRLRSLSGFRSRADTAQHCFGLAASMSVRKREDVASLRLAIFLALGSTFDRPVSTPHQMMVGCAEVDGLSAADWVFLPNVKA